MLRDELAHLLDGGGTTSQACRTALLGGAEFMLWDQATPAERMVPAFERRHARSQELGRETDGLAETVTALRHAGNGEVRQGSVTLTERPYVFMFFLAGDPASVIACFGADR